MKFPRYKKKPKKQKPDTYLKISRKGHPYIQVKNGYKYCPCCKKIKKIKQFTPCNQKKLGSYCAICARNKTKQYGIRQKFGLVNKKLPNGAWKDVNPSVVARLNKLDKNKNLKPFIQRSYDFERFFQTDKKIENDTIDKIYKSMNSLTEAERETLLLWMRDIPVKTISSLVNISLVCTYQRLKSAQNHLKYALNSHMNMP